MAVTLKTLTGEDIPSEHRRPDLEALIEVKSHDGTLHYLESEEEAANLVVDLHKEDQEEGG
ncbi:MULTISPECIES: hypothetical protein [Pseudomonas]|jgi:hypothetical protein|uniref:Uncharacterized protein n=1 Tax=Pseudomonas folii TaxID=2762593 RepID=A0ABR7AV94_9PSED|nr:MULTISPECIES: hypothetical protein [Pseudomonas]MBC3948824.1 hypothetical protein [Pseudomonas folii]